MPSPDTLREFLRMRRAEIDPASVGLPPSPTPRRGRGLRREEVAALAGVSVDYYARLEQGRVGNISDQVLNAIENVLRLNALEREHLRSLVSPSVRVTPRPPRPTTLRPRLALRGLIDKMDAVPAILQGPRLEILATNQAARTLFTDFDALPVDERNIARWIFLDPATRTKYPDWEDVAAPVAATLRTNRDPHTPDAALERLVGELSVASPEFARYWADYRLFEHGNGKKRVFHELVGVMTLNYETLTVPGSGGQFLSTYTADVGSPSDEKLRILLSWAEIPEDQQRAAREQSRGPSTGRP
ncbi:helix-turn-helix transcriptional regulator [Nocardia callitridis]|uniref:Helix-turn-helix transcriptional regulator n=1 Tax=Nocardia callitridis TaxID=648753 RepID=A0ABP9KQ72_9NOCA